MESQSTEGLSDMRSALRKERLPLPPVPERLCDKMRRLRDWAWGSMDEIQPLYDIEYYVERCISAPADEREFVLVGQSGYGTNSWFFHSFVSTERVSIFVQSPWGGAYGDASLAIERLRLRYDVMEKLLEAVHEAVESGRSLPGRLIVQQSAMTAPRWAWVKEGQPVTWQEEVSNAMTPAMESLSGHM